MKRALLAPRLALAIVATLAGVSSQGMAQEVTSRPARPVSWVTDEVKADRLVFRTFASEAVRADVSYHAYTPPVYDQTSARLPVLYWLHGTAGGVNGVRPVARLFDDLIRRGTIPPMIVVFANGLAARLWADSKDGSTPVETVFIKELIPNVDKTFRTIAAREGRIVEGFSMGGFGAARLGFKYADLFAGVSMLAAGPLDPEFQGPRAMRSPAQRERVLRLVCSDDLDYFKALNPWAVAAAAADALRERKPAIRQAVGDMDFSLDDNRKFHERMTQLGIEHEFIEVSKVPHDAKALLEALGEKNGAFYRRALGQRATSQPTSR